MTSGLATIIVTLTASGWLLASNARQEARAEAPRWRTAVGAARVFGAEELVVGRTFDGKVAELLLEARRLTRVDLEAGHVRTIDLVGLRGDDRPWGLARLEDGARWTLVDRWTLALLSSDGKLTSRHPLTAPHLGLYGLGMRLLYQAFEVDPRQLGASLGPPGNLYRHKLVFDGQGQSHRAAAVSRLENLLGCGTSVIPMLPCWLPGLHTLHLVHESGAVDRVVLPAVALGGASGDNTRAANVVRDATIDSARRTWVLMGRTNAVQSPDAPPANGRQLVVLAPGGQVLGRVTLEVDARLILGATASACYLLTSEGLVATVHPA
jgi:hypothetical protein